MDRSDSRATAVIYTVGHSNHPVDRFIKLIETAGIRLIVDVRSVPYSRFVPQFNKAAVEKALAATGIGYCYMGHLLGGRAADGGKGSPLTWKEAAAGRPFREGIEQLVELSGSRRTAVMCAEKDPNRCHRKHLIAAALVTMGVTVIHLLEDGTSVSEQPEILFPPSG